MTPSDQQHEDWCDLVIEHLPHYVADPHTMFCDDRLDWLEETLGLPMVDDDGDWQGGCYDYNAAGVFFARAEHALAYQCRWCG